VPIPSARRRANPARQSALSTGRILDEAHPISAAFRCFRLVPIHTNANSVAVTPKI
jgi:hypothetical protein